MSAVPPLSSATQIAAGPFEGPTLLMSRMHCKSFPSWPRSSGEEILLSMSLNSGYNRGAIR
jgi:hypothetical protein